MPLFSSRVSLLNRHGWPSQRFWSAQAPRQYYRGVAHEDGCREIETVAGVSGQAKMVINGHEKSPKMVSR
jgi:hypothetical protein